MNFDDRSLVRRVVTLSTDERRFFVVEREGKRIDGVSALRRSHLLQCFSSINDILVVLEVTVGAIVVILGLLILVDRFREILLLRLCVLPGQYFKQMCLS